MCRMWAPRGSRLIWGICMKTKELIRQLQENDPTGECEVCVENIDIHFVCKEEAYWDGPLQVLQRDETCKYYNIIGGKYKTEGSKIVIRPLSFADAILNRDIPIDYSELTPDKAAVTKKVHDDRRAWHKTMKNELELETFTEWLKEHASKLTVDLDIVKDMAESFFERHLSADDPLPEGGVPLGMNYIECRKKQWDKKYNVTIDGGFLKIVQEK